MNKNMRCLSLGVWLFQNSCFQLHPFTCEFHNFIFLNSRIIVLGKCTMTHSSVGHLHCFCFLVIMNRAAMNTANSYLNAGKRAFEYHHSWSYGRPISEEPPHWFYGGCQFYSYQQWGSVPLSHHLLSFSFFRSVILTGMRWSLKVVLSSGVRGWGGGEAEGWNNRT